MYENGLELLSPAGNIEICKGVIGAGADAVYFGGDMFGARAYAKNFTREEGAEAISYAHLYGRKAYLTVNTLLKNREMEHLLYDYIKFYCEAGVDAVIVQDIGVLDFIRHYFPQLSIHASTQMTITNAYGANFVKNLGVSRVVTARELSIEEIRSIRQKTTVEIEAFVHGALCMAYSGQCLMSSMLGGRSGNRGRCAQPCRLPYRLLHASGRELKTEGDYLLSPKDLCGIGHLKALADAGVYSFKIEGRMKQLSYATGVVSVYRKYIDALLEGKEAAVDDADKKTLFDLGNRSGFTDRYFFMQNDKSMISYEKPSHEKKETTAVRICEPKLHITGCFTARAELPIQLQVTYKSYCLTVSGVCAQIAQNEPTGEETVREKLHKTGNTPFVFDRLQLTMDENLFIPIAKINELRRDALAKLEKNMVAVAPRTIVARNSEDYAMPCTEAAADKSKRFTAVCKTREQLKALVSCDFLDVICYDMASLFSAEDVRRETTEIARLVKSKGKAFWLQMPLICRSRATELLLENPCLFAESSVDGILATSVDALGFLEELHYPKERIHADYRIYTFSDVSIAALQRLGYEDICAPPELNQKELLHRYNDTSDMLLYGRIPLMITANCQKKNALGCDKKETLLYLKDRYRESFPVKNRCTFCYNEIYNSKIYHILSESEKLKTYRFKGYRLDFSLEGEQETKNILDTVRKCFFESENDKMSHVQSAIFTKGHWNRGVE